MVAEYARFKNLTNLEIGGTDITPTVFKKFPVMKSVTKLILNRTQANDETLRDVVEKFPNVESLQLKQTQIRDQGLLELKVLPLVALNVVDCKVTPAALNELKGAIGAGLSIVRFEKKIDHH